MLVQYYICIYVFALLCTAVVSGKTCVWDIQYPTYIDLPKLIPENPLPVRDIRLIRGKIWVSTGSFLTLLDPDTLISQVNSINYMYTNCVLVFDLITITVFLFALNLFIGCFCLYLSQGSKFLDGNQPQPNKLLPLDDVVLVSTIKGCNIFLLDPVRAEVLKKINISPTSLVLGTDYHHMLAYYILQG